MAEQEKRVIEVAECPTHGLHGQRKTCFECGGPVVHRKFVNAALLESAERDIQRNVDAAIAIEQRATRERDARESAESELRELREGLKELLEAVDAHRATHPFFTEPGKRHPWQERFGDDKILYRAANRVRSLTNQETESR